MRKKFSEEEVAEILRLYESGMTQKDIGLRFQSYNTSIRRVLNRHNIRIRSNSEIQSYLEHDRFTSACLTREEYYYLGLLITDGCISNNCLTFGLQEKDLYMLDQFAKFLGSKVRVNSYFHKRHNKLQYQVSIRNKSICDNLSKLAIFVDKSHNLELKIPLNFDILRGIIDGDGCVSLCRNLAIVSIATMSKKFADQLHEFLIDNGINNKIRMRKSDGLLSVHIVQQKLVFQLYKLLYNGTNLYLQRKKDKYGSLVEKFTSKNIS